MAEPSSTVKHSKRETFNQIVLMLIVAFSLRVFVVEAFVIPTGSMGPTLKGAHYRFDCDNCGNHFDVNYSSRPSSPGEINIPRYSRGNDRDIYCPNCGYRLPPSQTATPRIYYGDRILVLKYSYLLRPPQRWDVVVFKSPASPQLYDYSQAYIKRLIGLPGEQIMILDGDIYATRESNPQPSDWRIQRKPDVVQDALWRLVNDSSHAPRGLTPESAMDEQTFTADSYQPWKPGDDSWRYTRDQTGAVAFRFMNLKGQSTLSFDQNVGERKYSLTDWLGYDQVPGQGPLTAVGDLRLSLFFHRLGGVGPLDLKLSKGNDLFIARIEPKTVSLLKASMADPGNTTLLASAPYEFSGQPAKLDFMNLDYTVRLLIDGEQVLATTPEQYAPDIDALHAQFTNTAAGHDPGVYPTVSVSAANQVATLTHLSLWRDVYYTNRGDRFERGDPAHPVHLASDEYFTLGDNSAMSQDGRFWEDPVHLPAEGVDAQAGVVPDRFMLGKAFFVYWPAGYRLGHRNAPDLIPNFGEVRFIH